MARRSLEHRIVAALEARRRSHDPVDRLDASRRLREAAEELESVDVQLARDQGATWTEIGARYGLTKQGAQQRFRVPRAAPDAAPVSKVRRRVGEERGAHRSS